MKEKKTSNIFLHHYPAWLMRRPRLIHFIYLWNKLTQLRSWYIMREIHRMMNKGPIKQVLDAGFGEGMYLFPLAKKNPAIQWYGIDKEEEHLQFGERYKHRTRLSSLRLYHSALPRVPKLEKIDLILLIGVLQYIEHDRKAISSLKQVLRHSPPGKLLIYVPIRGKILFPWYRFLFQRLPQYESLQNRKRIYEKEALVNLVSSLGMNIEKIDETYGFWGKIGYECYHSCLLLVVHLHWIGKPFVFLFLLAILPLILLCYLLDFLLPVTKGNGCLLIASKQ